MQRSVRVWSRPSRSSPTGSRLWINARCEADGYVDVEVTDAWGSPWDGYSRQECQTFTGDSVHHPVAWASSETVNDIATGVKLKFYLRNAELYGFQFADSVAGYAVCQYATSLSTGKTSETGCRIVPGGNQRAVPFQSVRSLGGE